ncbi:MAG: hypothetical protein K0S53_834 [Bacteroidetes bacterium]|jgi:hypothetical protein|nr:hypothetical protein [Bacteroidota bacterium]MDF2451463.1 hypothetical protein [Bacteroidota bacterium]
MAKSKLMEMNNVGIVVDCYQKLFAIFKYEQKTHQIF